MRKLLFAAFVVAALAGCSSTPTQDAAPVEDRAAAAAGAGTTGATTSGTTGAGVAGAATGAAGARSPLTDPSSPLSKRSVYFDYDQYVVKDEYRALVDSHAKYLQANRSARITIQGNTDERGTREYNIALGQKRADALKKLMVLLGASESQIETVSFGKEKPRRDGHDEASWAENRRDDIVYAGE